MWMNAHGMKLQILQFFKEYIYIYVKLHIELFDFISQLSYYISGI